jgi:hypothetical protein
LSIQGGEQEQRLILREQTLNEFGTKSVHAFFRNAGEDYTAAWRQFCPGPLAYRMALLQTPSLSA